MTKRRAKQYSNRRLTWMVISAFFVVCCGLPGFAALIAKPTTAPPTVAALGFAAQNPTAAKPSFTPKSLMTAIKTLPTLPIAAGETYATVLVNRLNVHSDPGNGGVLLGTLGKGERVKLEARVKDGSWAGFAFKGRRGWISTAADLIAVTGEGIAHVSLIDVATRPAVTSGPMSRPTAKSITAGGGGSCPNVRATCSQISTCAEARACLVAGNRSLDRDHDGVPCESLCGG